jgi:hypothetical protein
MENVSEKKTCACQCGAVLNANNKTGYRRACWQKGDPDGYRAQIAANVRTCRARKKLLSSL